MSDGGLTINIGGVAQVLFNGAIPVGGFEVCNVDLTEELWLSDSTIATIGGSGCYRLPGGGYTYRTPYGYKPLGPVSVIAASAGHRITARKWSMPLGEDIVEMPDNGPWLPLAGGELVGNLTITNGARLHMLGNPVDAPVLYIGPWTDRSTNLHQSLFIQHWYDAPAGGPLWVGSPIGIQINITGTPSYYVWGINLETDINTVGGPPEVRPQHVGYATTTRRHRSNDICFAYYGMIEDMSGQNIGSDVGFELDINCSGPEPLLSAYQPGFGGRSMIEINNNAYPHVAWAANHAYLKDAVVAPGNGHVYVCQTAGTSGATAPVWPTSGTITDGTVTWAYGTAFTNEISRAISIAAGSNSAYGAGIMFTGKFYDACLDLSFATRDLARNPKAVGIRLANQMQIDFSGDGTEAGQSRHQLWWDGPTQSLVYASNVPLLMINDVGVIKIIPPPVFPDDAAAAVGGLPIGGIYCTGSTLKVRVA